MLLLLLIATGSRLIAFEVDDDHDDSGTGETVRLMPFHIDDYEEQTGAVHYLAVPSITFAADGPHLEPFGQELPNPQYMVIDGERHFRLGLPWRMQWLDEVYGAGMFTVEFFVRLPGEPDFEEWWTDASHQEEWGPYFQEGWLEIPLYLETPGFYEVHVVLRLEGIARTGEEGEEIFDLRETSFETTVIAFSHMWAEEMYGSEFFAPRFGDLESYGVLLDWRAWGFGPCDLHSTRQDVTLLVDEACQAYEDSDLETVEAVLQEALPLTDEDDPAFVAALRNQLGFLAATDGRAIIALRHFREALFLWQTLDNAWQTTIALHNLGVALMASDRQEEGDARLHQSIQLGEQIDNYPGIVLSWVQLAIFWEDREVFYDILDALAEVDLPQAELIEDWLISQGIE